MFAADLLRAFTRPKLADVSIKIYDFISVGYIKNVVAFADVGCRSPGRVIVPNLERSRVNK